MPSILLTCLLLAVSFLPLQAQVIRGFVRDASTGQTLPAANIVIKNSYTGTISNNDGRFELEIDEFPATLMIRYIGYYTKELTLTAADTSVLIVNLEPNIKALKEIVVTGGNPAIEIMQEVIKRKKEWRGTLETYKAEAYSRQRLESNQQIASITETLSDIHWDRKKGSREVIRSKRQTENIKVQDNVATAAFLPNFYDDNINVAGSELVGPTHPDAFNFYNFNLLGVRTLDDVQVFDIEVTPKRKLQPTFVGRISVLDSVYAMIEVDLKPGDAIFFPPPIQKFNLAYAQQFSNYGGSYWLPVDVRVRGEVQFGVVGLQFPEIGIEQVSRITNYQVNVVLPDSLYEEGNRRRVRVDSVAVKMDTLFVQSSHVIPLTTVEEQAYATIDSTKTLDKAFEPKGFFARFVRNSQDDNDDAGSGSGSGSGGGSASFRSRISLTPELRLTRVEGFYLGGTVSYPLSRSLRIRGGGGYGFTSETYAYQSGLSWRPSSNRRWLLTLDWKTGIESRYPASLLDWSINTNKLLLGRMDDFDYYRSSGLEADVQYRIRGTRSRWNLTLRNEEHTSVVKVSDFSLLNPDPIQRPNPAIEEGWMRSATLGYTYGGNPIPFGIAGQNRTEIKLEVSNPNIFQSDYEFMQLSMIMDRRLETFYRRRFFPNTLDMRLEASVSSGDVPLQRFGFVKNASSIYSSFGSLKSTDQLPYEGQHYLAYHWEHNFRSIFFEAMGLSWFAKKGWGFLVYGSHARTFLTEDKKNELKQRTDYTLSYSDSFHHEVGLALNGVFGFSRINLTKRLDAPGLRLGIGVTRYF